LAHTKQQSSLDTLPKVLFCGELTEPQARQLAALGPEAVQLALLAASDRGSTNELIAFLYYARGSAGEVRSILCLTERLDRFNHLKSQISNLKSMAESCSRQIRGWADHHFTPPTNG